MINLMQLFKILEKITFMLKNLKELINLEFIEFFDNEYFYFLRNILIIH
jgi:hypothetical protein